MTDLGIKHRMCDKSALITLRDSMWRLINLVSLMCRGYFDNFDYTSLSVTSISIIHLLDDFVNSYIHGNLTYFKVKQN